MLVYPISKFTDKQFDPSPVTEISRSGLGRAQVSMTHYNMNFMREGLKIKRAPESPRYLQVFLAFPEALGSGTAQVGTPKRGKTKTWRMIQTATIPIPTKKSFTEPSLSSRTYPPFLSWRLFPSASLLPHNRRTQGLPWGQNL